MWPPSGLGVHSVCVSSSYSVVCALDINPDLLIPKGQIVTPDPVSPQRATGRPSRLSRPPPLQS